MQLSSIPSNTRDAISFVDLLADLIIRGEIINYETRQKIIEHIRSDCFCAQEDPAEVKLIQAVVLFLKDQSDEQI